MKIKGIDISHWQANVSFEKLVANEIAFAIFKAGEIPTTSKQEFLDGMYARNIREAKEHGIISGAYYFFHPSIDPYRQSKHFGNIMKAYGEPDLPPVIDVECQDKMNPADIAKVLKKMIWGIENMGYRKPIIYSRWGFLVNQMGEPDWLKEHLLWLAQYSTELTNKPKDMSNVIMWQYTDRLRLPGIGVALDGNYWLKSEDELNKLAGIDEPGIVEPPKPPLTADPYCKKWIAWWNRRAEIDPRLQKILTGWDKIWKERNERV